MLVEHDGAQRIAHSKAGSFERSEEPVATVGIDLWRSHGRARNPKDAGPRARSRPIVRSAISFGAKRLWPLFLPHTCAKKGRDLTITLLVPTVAACGLTVGYALRADMPDGMLKCFFKKFIRWCDSSNAFALAPGPGGKLRLVLKNGYTQRVVV